jgi:hypothetical protein
LIALALTSAIASSVLAGPTVEPGGSTVAGKTIGQWTADWWNWTGSVTGNVFTDTTGALATQNQSGPVFFVAGTQGTSVTRTFDVPGDKFLLFPLINFVVANGPDPGFADTQAEAKALIDVGVPASNVFASIDGADVPNLASHREASPVNFTYTALAGSGTFTPGTFTDANSDGYWVMVDPLGSGTHTLRFGGTTNVIDGPDPSFHLDSFDVDVTDNVKAGSASAIPLPNALASGSALGAVALVVVQMNRRHRALA